MYVKPHGFVKTLSTSGDSESLTGSDISSPGLTIQTGSTNSESIFVGDNKVSSSHYAWELPAGTCISISAVDFGWAHAELRLKDFYIISTTTGDTVSVGWLERIENE